MGEARWLPRSNSLAVLLNLNPKILNKSCPIKNILKQCSFITSRPQAPSSQTGECFFPFLLYLYIYILTEILVNSLNASLRSSLAVLERWLLRFSLNVYVVWGLFSSSMILLRCSKLLTLKMMFLCLRCYAGHKIAFIIPTNIYLRYRGALYVILKSHWNW